MSSMADALRWWNSTVSSLPVEKRPPRCTVPQATTAVFTKILPILAVNVQPTKTDQQYWCDLRIFIARFLCTQNVPDPLVEFSEFLSFLYSKRNVMNPKTVDDCMKFFVYLSLSFGNSAIIYQAPKYIGDPNLYLMSLLRLKDTNHPFWMQFLTGTYEMDTLFNLYSSFHVPSGNFSSALSTTTINNKNFRDAWSFRLAVAEIVYEITLASLSGNPNAEEYLQLFNTNTIEIIKEAPSDVALCLSRFYVQLTKRIMLTCHEDELSDYAFHFLVAVSKKELAYNYVLRFFMNVKPRILRGFKMLKVVTMVGIRSTNDIQTLCDLSLVAGPAPIIVCLGWHMLQSKVWHRACLAAILQLAIQNDSDGDVREWLTHFIKMLFMFVALTVLRGKYEQRAVLICESLARIMHGGLPWMRRLVMISAASTWATGSTPSYFERFFTIVRETDPKFAEEYNLLLMMDIDMKFFPFDGNTLKLVTIFPTKPKLSKFPKVNKPPAAPKTLKVGKRPKKSKKKGGTKSGKTLTTGVAPKKRSRVPKTLA